MDLNGRQLSAGEVLNLQIPASSLAQAQTVPAIIRQGNKLKCQRCGSFGLSVLPNGQHYCSACVNLGRVMEGELLYRWPATPIVQDGTLTWQGQLTPEQAAVSQSLIASTDQHRDHLLWAVTGAGKTEMLFPVLAHALAQGQRVVVASPRIDVILELAPRLQAAFAQLKVAVYYGGSGEQPDSQLVLATTHQLLRFYHAFDLTIVDEVDAFPFAANPMLAFAVQQASLGAVIYLTATPGRDLMRRVQAKTLNVSYLPRRFHGAPLPVPQVAFGRQFQRLPTKVRRQLTQIVTSGRQVLVFVPQIDWLPAIAAVVASLGFTVATVHAEDPERTTKVQQFRQGTWQVLVTTTILERGVTIYRCGVIVLQADSPLFSAAALIQMAGRAGRSADSPDDPVWFFVRHYTRSLAIAHSQIAAMNRRGQDALSPL